MKIKKFFENSVSDNQIKSEDIGEFYLDMIDDDFKVEIKNIIWTDSKYELVSNFPKKGYFPKYRIEIESESLGGHDRQSLSTFSKVSQHLEYFIKNSTRMSKILNSDIIDIGLDSAQGCYYLTMVMKDTTPDELIKDESLMGLIELIKSIIVQDYYKSKYRDSIKYSVLENGILLELDGLVISQVKSIDLFIRNAFNRNFKFQRNRISSDFNYPSIKKGKDNRSYSIEILKK